MDKTGKDFLGTGWSFPPQFDRSIGHVETVSFEQDIEQSIYLILSTSRGERVMRPDFGCGIHDLVFAVVNTALIAEIQSVVTDALRKYEARIDVDRVSVDQSRITRGQLLVVVDYVVRSTNQIGNYVFPFYFKEAT